MSFSCPQCGAIYPQDETCLDRFNLSQSMELDDPAYYAVHHLSVPCYMLQHNAYSREGWLEVRTLLSKFVHEGWTPDMARRQIQVKMDSGSAAGASPGGLNCLAWKPLSGVSDWPISGWIPPKPIARMSAAGQSASWRTRNNYWGRNAFRIYGIMKALWGIAWCLLPNFSLLINVILNGIPGKIR